MAQEKDNLDIIEDEDLGGITVTSAKDTRKVVGSDVNPIDELTGERLFDDIPNRFTASLGAPDEAPPKKKVVDEEEDVEDETEAEEEEEPEAEAEEDEEEEPAPRSSSVAKRVARARRRRQEGAANVRDLKQDIDELRAQVTGRVSDEEFTRTQADLDGKIANAKTELEAALEAGDSKKQAELLDKLVGLRADKKASEITHANAKTAAEKSTTTASRVVARKAMQWKRRHPRFNTDAEYAEVARGIDRALGKEGFDPETDEFWEEMDARLAKHYPTKKKARDEGDEEETTRRRPGAPSQNLRREADGKRRPKMLGRFQVRGKGIYLSASQKENMVRFGMDPKNPNDVKAYIQNNS